MEERETPREDVTGGRRSSPTTERALALLSEAGPATGGDFIRSVLAGLRTYLDMDVAFIGEFADDQRIFRYLDTASGDFPSQVGAGSPLERSVCHHVVTGRLPEFMADCAADSTAAGVVTDIPLPSAPHLSVPVMLADGSVYGTFCTFSYRDSPVSARDLELMRFLASLIAQQLEAERAARLAADEEVAEIRRVIDARQLSTVFQPILDLLTDEVVGYEALTRFTEGTPDQWFGKAARTGHAVPLEMAAIHEALSHFDALPPDTYLAVNLSPSTLCSATFAEAAPSMPLHRMVIELTEQSSVESYPDLISRAQWLRSAGARIAIDDAGAGYAGLQRILAVAPDIVKLDRQLISGIDSDQIRQSLASAMSWFTSRSGNRLIAEGIETLAERKMLISLGIRFGQGYQLGRPGPLPQQAPRALPAARHGFVPAVRGAATLRSLPELPNSRPHHPAAHGRDYNKSDPLKWLA